MGTLLNFPLKDFYNKQLKNSKYLNNKKLINSIYLYINRLYISSKNENINYNKADEEFYIVKRKFIIDFQKENNYKQIKQILEGKITKIPKGENDILDIINNLYKKDLKEIDNMNNFQMDKNPTDPTIYEIDINPVYNPINSSE